MLTYRVPAHHHRLFYQGTGTANLGAGSSADAELGVPDLPLERVRARQGVLLRRQVLLQRVLHLHIVRAAVLVHQLACAGEKM